MVASEAITASTSGARRPSAASKSSSAPAPPSRSARSRSRLRALAIFASSAPAIRYAGFISATRSSLGSRRDAGRLDHAALARPADLSALLGHLGDLGLIP